MAIFSNDVADKVLRVLQSANRIDQQKLLDARAAGNGNSADVLERMIRNEGVDEELVHTVLSRAYSLRRASLEAKEVDVRALPLIPAKFIDEHRALPFAVENRFLRIGIVDPTTATQASQLKSVSNFNIEFQLITLTNFESLRGHERIKSVLDSAEKREKQERARVGAKAKRSRFALDDDELVPEFCDHILHTALETGTSDIRFAILPASASGLMVGLSCARNIRIICCGIILAWLHASRSWRTVTFRKSAFPRMAASPSPMRAKMSISASMFCQARMVNGSSCEF